MAWTTPKTMLPLDTLTAADMNTYVRDNLLETLVGQTPGDDRIAVSVGPGEVAWRSIELTSTAVSTTTTSTSPVDVGPTISGVEHSGRVLVLITGTLRHNSGELASYSVAPTTGPYGPHIIRAIRAQGSNNNSLSCHVLYYDIPSPCDFTGYLWAGGPGTSTLTRGQYTVIPL
jgi:hypothetical protein